MFILTITHILTISCIAVATADFSFHPVASVTLDRGAEILAYDHSRHNIFVIGADGTSIYSLDTQQILTQHPSNYAPENSAPWEPTSIDIDPIGRRFGVISWIPPLEDRISKQGVLQFFDTDSFETIRTMEIGYHPDCVMFTPNGSKVLIANECEAGQSGDHRGGLGIIELSQASRDSLLSGEIELNYYDLTGQRPLHDTLRISKRNADHPELDVEPEYLAPSEEGVWVSLQENNGLAYFDFNLTSWTNILNLGVSKAPLDPLDNEAAMLFPNLGIEMLYQPDTIVRFESNGGEYLLLANEGEGDDDDVIEFGKALALGMLDMQSAEELIGKLPSDQLEVIRKLRISTIDGDTDSDGDIDVPTTLGARGISILDASTGNQIWESQEQLEVVSALLNPDLYNHGDSRSDRSGPEPEGLAIGYLGDRVLGFVGLERAHMVFMYDLTNPKDPEILDVVELDSACYPEGLKFIEHDGKYLLLVAAERCEQLLIFEVKKN